MKRLTVLPEENEHRLDYVLGRLLPDAQERIDRTETALSDKKF